MLSEIKHIWELSYSTYLFVFFLSVLIGIGLAILPFLKNREKRKKRFKSNKLFGKDRSIDKRISKDMSNGGTYRIDADSDTFRVLLSDDTEFHANKKF